MITVVADQHIYKLNEVIPESVNLITFDAEDGFPREVEQADALLIRTVSRVDRSTLQLANTKLRFVGTASAGYDHIDTDYLQEHNVAFGHSPGCNANSVAEYITTSLLIWAEKTWVPLKDICVGIIGYGNVGGATARFLESLGVEYRTYDPPREMREGSAGYRSASAGEVLSCDVLTFHTPLTFNGEHPTYHWLDSSKLGSRRYRLIINAARGGIIDEQALRVHLDNGNLEQYILDVWEHEPLFSRNMVQGALFATPHIAGYSLEAKNNATRQVAEAMARVLGIDSIGKLRTPIKEINEPSSYDNYNSLCHLLSTVHPISSYDRQLRQLSQQILSDRELAVGFNRLRTLTELRHEFQSIHLSKNLFDRYPILNRLGFKQA